MVTRLGSVWSGRCFSLRACVHGVVASWSVSFGVEAAPGDPPAPPLKDAEPLATGLSPYPRCAVCTFLGRRYNLLKYTFKFAGQIMHCLPHLYGVHSNVGQHQCSPRLWEKLMVPGLREKVDWKHDGHMAVDPNCAVWPCNQLTPRYRLGGRLVGLAGVRE
jgi:hypothetical protein